MDRVANWNIKATEEIGSLVGSSFVWGETDCASIGRKTIKIMYGRDMFPSVPKYSYKTRIGAARVFKRLGSIRKLIESVGGVKIPVQALSDGDIAIEDTDKGFQNIATMIGSRWIVCNEESGVIESRKILQNEHITLYRI